MKTATKPMLSVTQRNYLLALLETRFARHPARHRGITWAQVLARLESNSEKLRSLAEMENTGGEPDVIGRDKATGALLFVDCSPQSPADRQSVCFDRAALDARKEHKPKTSALDLAAEMGVELLDEAQYRALQRLGEFDTKTSSWIKTPAAIRQLGGALFCDRRYDHVFTYHNGAQSYYRGRGFRAILRV
ncbi:MAG: DUF4256 domain-containing protein [Opitutaceae bacterium]|nr:DUF4256 domain-containing protein [Opitutaceae bacterium]